MKVFTLFPLILTFTAWLVSARDFQSVKNEIVANARAGGSLVQMKYALFILLIPNRWH